MGGDVNAQDKYNETPIHVALLCFNSNTGADITVLTYLLTQKGLNANMKDPEGNALLYIACEKINRLPLDVFKFLIETMGLDLNARSGRPTTPLHYVLAFFNPNKGGDIDVLTYLLNQKNIDANIKNQYGSTLLHHACNNINKLPLDVFKVLIETHGGDVNTLNNPNDTPLHLAIRHFDPDYGGDINVLTYVINQNNVNVNIKNRNGFNLLHLTCTNNLPSSSRSVELNAECDSILCHIVEVIVEKCIQQVLNETTS
jgi:ankyrin repeat protein